MVSRTGLGRIMNACFYEADPFSFQYAILSLRGYVKLVSNRVVPRNYFVG